jgi:hypothetical protein
MDPSCGILLADSTSVESARALATADAHWFLMDDGIRALPALHDLIDSGSDVTVCATDAAGLEPVPGVRYGSQYDHAVMVRTAARVIGLTGMGLDDHTPKRAERTVIVRVTRAAKMAQALRSAVGYAGGDLRVALLLEPDALSLATQPQADRALATLRSLDHPVVSVAPGQYPARLRWDVEIRW